jgi:hypothetical protein
MESSNDHVCSFGLKLSSKKLGPKRARVAVARKLAVLLAFRGGRRGMMAKKRRS